jgi:PAS domain S-box-containing protein
MAATAESLDLEEMVRQRTEVLFQERVEANYRRGDHTFAWLMGIQWLAGIVAAVWISPKAWEGQYSHPHIHLWVALFLGGIIYGYPVGLALKRPGAFATRHAIAAAQMLGGGLLIHLTGGRIETHFQYFAALAFLSFYRDWRVLLTATLVSAADHFARGIFWPQSIFGVLTPSGWRALEHASWILYEDVFLLIGIRQNIRDMLGVAEGQAKLESFNETIDLRVEERTSELQREVSERRRAEESLRLLRSAVEQATESIMVTDAQLDEPGPRIVFVNPAFTKITGFSSQEVLGKSPRILQGARTDKAVLRRLRQKLQKGEVVECETINYRKNQEEFFMQWQTAPICAPGGEITHFVAIQHDVTERKRAEQKALAAVQREVVLRREIHHRVKNNLQIITSLLYLQSTKVNDPNLLALLNENQARIRSIALVHEMLYQREDLAKISFSAYVQQLGSDLLAAYRVTQGDIALKISSANVFLDLNTAIPCGIIVTELITNALKYAFPHGGKGEITIGLLPETRRTWTLTVADNGIGLPREVDLERLQTMGLSMVHDLAGQLGGRVEIGSCPLKHGTIVKVTLPEPPTQGDGGDAP